MSKKFIQEYQNNNFVYPNNDPYEYGVDIIHNINNNYVTGSISGFTVAYSGSNLAVSFNYQWLLNGAVPYIAQNGYLNVLSVHMMAPGQNYFKPWRMIGFVNDINTNITGKTGTFTTIVTPASMGLTTFTTGTTYFEVRMIGKREVSPICVETSIGVQPTPTPTPTPTKTPTPSSPCYCYEIVVTGTTGGEGGGIANLVYNDCFGVQTGRVFTVGPGTYYQCIQTVDSVVQYDPVLTTGIDQSYLTIPGVGNCNTGYACTGYTPATTATPTPTPTQSSGSPVASVTPTPTPTKTPTPTPTPSAGILTSVGTTDIVGATTCTSIGTTPEIFLDATDYAKFVSNGGCFSDGGSSTVSVIRDAGGAPITGTFYFTWYGTACSYTTFKSTVGNLTLNPTQC